MKRLHLIVFGKVQGVSYRDYVRRQAEKHKISGFVKNLHNGTVEIVAEGDEENLPLFLRECKRGSLLAFVQKADVTELEATGEFEEFQIRF